jgi:CRP-like cAMP-binding protein
MLVMNSNLIKNVKLFNLGSPQFLLSLTFMLYPKVCMKNDIIVRRGEIAEEFFIIKKGKVEVLATDETTVISKIKSNL